MKRYKLLIAIGLSAVLGIASLGTALAGGCWSDPIVAINAPGMRAAEISIDVGVDGKDKSDVSLVEIIVTVPSNVNAHVTFMDGNLPEVVTIVHSSEVWQAGQTVKVNVKLRVVSTKTFDTAFTVTHKKADGRTEVLLTTSMSNVWTANEFGLFVRQ